MTRTWMCIAIPVEGNAESGLSGILETGGGRR